MPPEVRAHFTSDMRIVADFLAEGNSYRSDRPVRHKEALIKMIRALSGEEYVEDTAEVMKACEIREEDEIKVCELFDQYERKGRQEGLQRGIQCVIATCRDFNATFEQTAVRIREQFKLDEAAVQENMQLYW